MSCHKGNSKEIKNSLTSSNIDEKKLSSESESVAQSKKYLTGSEASESQGVEAASQDYHNTAPTAP